MSFLLVDVAIVGSGFMLGRWLVRRMRRRGHRGPAATLASTTDAAALPHDPFEGLPCKLGDVLVRAGQGDEAWLAGALVFSEDRPVAALFIAPEAGGDRAIWVRHAAALELVWLAPIAKGQAPTLAQSGEPPHAIAHDGVHYQRIRRLPVKIARLGTGAPSLGAQAIIAEYTGAGVERLLVVVAETTLAWSGVALREVEYEVLPGDASTLEV